MSEQWHQLLKERAGNPEAYAAYNAAAIELEERIAAMRALPEEEQPKSLLEGLLMVHDGPLTINGIQVK